MTTGTTNPLSGYNPVQFGSPSPHDVVVIAGSTSPGLCVPSGFKRKWKWDAKNGKGAQGADLTYVQKHPIEGQLTFWVWTALQFTLWEAFRPLFKYDPTRQNVQAVSIFMPVLADLDIGQVVCDSIGPFEHAGHGLWRCEVELREWIPPPKAAAVSTPTQAKTTATGSTGNPAAPAPTDPQQIKIAQLLKQFQTP